MKSTKSSAAKNKHRNVACDVPPCIRIGWLELTSISPLTCHDSPAWIPVI